MHSGILRAAHFTRHWLRPDADVSQDEVVLEPGPGEFEATHLRPVGRPSRPAWILLHGITRPGRRHPVLVRFARALAGSGACVVIPEIPEWTALELDPGAARDATLAALAALEQADAPPGGVGLMGFSFGAPQAIRLAGDPEIGPRLSCVAGFGGYDTLERAVAFLWSGEQEWEGRSFRTRPDPYGRWVVGANFLPRVPGWEDAGRVAEALATLAATAGDRKIPSLDPALDPVKDRLEASLPPGARELFRRFAPPASGEPPGDPGGWAARLARAGVAARPGLELPPVPRVPVPVVLLHGRGDSLVPFSETLRLGARIQAPKLHVAVTGLFEHSEAAGGREPGWAGELWRLGRSLASLLGSV